MEAARSRLGDLQQRRQEDRSGRGDDGLAEVEGPYLGRKGVEKEGESCGVRRPVRQETQLPSGEDELAALEELLELIHEYDRHVYSRKTPLERLGHNLGPW